MRLRSAFFMLEYISDVIKFIAAAALFLPPTTELDLFEGKTFDSSTISSGVASSSDKPFFDFVSGCGGKIPVTLALQGLLSIIMTSSLLREGFDAVLLYATDRQFLSKVNRVVFVFVILIATILPSSAFVTALLGRLNFRNVMLSLAASFATTIVAMLLIASERWFMNCCGISSHVQGPRPSIVLALPKSMQDQLKQQWKSGIWRPKSRRALPQEGKEIHDFGIKNPLDGPVHDQQPHHKDYT